MSKRQRNPFEVLGLEPSYSLARVDLETRYRDVSRVYHPDRFSLASVTERTKALRHTTELNDAYRLLKNDNRRAECLLDMYGVDLSEESEHAGRTRHELSPEFLEEVMELREALAEAQAAGARVTVAGLRCQIEDKMAELHAVLRKGFDELLSEKTLALPLLIRTVLMQRYYQRFLDEISAYEDTEPLRS